MKSLLQFIQESKSNFLINKHTKAYNYHPQTRDELKDLVDKLIKERGNKANLNDIDTSAIIDMSYMFSNSQFNGDISNWDVSNVRSMYNTFSNSEFTGENGDLSKWDVSKVKNMMYMFEGSKFDGDISNWDVSNVTDMGFMFQNSKFSGDISNWDVKNVKYKKNMCKMFANSPLKNNPPSWYKQ